MFGGMLGSGRGYARDSGDADWACGWCVFEEEEEYGG